MWRSTFDATTTATVVSKYVQTTLDATLLTNQQGFHGEGLVHIQSIASAPPDLIYISVSHLR